MGYVRFLGHAAFELLIDGKVVLVDPWLDGNPLAAVKPDEISKVDLIIVTHDHGDHLGDAAKISKRTDAPVVTLYEVAETIEERGGKAIGANIGGPIRAGGLTVILTPAFHTGHCAGAIIKGEETTIYHAGDTGLFSDMGLYSKLYGVEIALLPIGGHFTMGPREAAEAVKLIRPKVAIPMHYNTFPPIRADPEEFKRLVEESGVGTKVVILKPGEKFEF